jgi:hypothetical protein
VAASQGGGGSSATNGRKRGVRGFGWGSPLEARAGQARYGVGSGDRRLQEMVLGGREMAEAEAAR